MMNLYQNSNNEPMVEIGIDYDKCFSIPLMDIVKVGLKEIVKNRFTKKEIKDNLSSWEDELYGELISREFRASQCENIVCQHNGYLNILNQFPEENNHTIYLKDFIEFQRKILLDQPVDFSKDLFRDVFFDNVKLVHYGRHIKHIKQKHRTSCGLACVAMIAGVSYAEIFNKAKNKFNFRYKFHTHHTHRKKLLNEYGLDLSNAEKVCSWNNVPDFSIAILEDWSSGETHAIVFLRKHGLMWFLDPNFDKVRYDFWNFNLRLIQYEEIIELR